MPVGMSGGMLSNIIVLYLVDFFYNLTWCSSSILVLFSSIFLIYKGIALKSTTLKYFKFMLIFLFYYLDSRLVNSVGNLLSLSSFTSWELAKSDVK